MTFDDTLLLMQALMNVGVKPDMRVCIPYEGALHTKLLEMGYRITLEETAWNTVEMVVTKL